MNQANTNQGEAAQSVDYRNTSTGRSKCLIRFFKFDNAKVNGGTKRRNTFKLQNEKNKPYHEKN